MLRGFQGELFTAKKRTREILNTCIQNNLRFVPEVKLLLKKHSSVNKFKDVYLPLSSTCQFSSTAR